MYFYLLAIKTIIYYLLIQFFRLGIAVNAIFCSFLFIDQAISFPGKYAIDEPRFQANTLSKRWYIARFFLIRSTPTGYEKLAERFEPIRNGENFLNEQ